MSWQYDNPYDAGYYCDGDCDDSHDDDSDGDCDDSHDDDSDGGCDDRSHHDDELDHGDYTPMTEYEHYVNANF